MAAELGAEVISPEELLATECDLLVPAALEDMIHDGNAHTIKARVLLELANGPVTPGGDKILDSKGICVLPDILANAGGVTVSYFEWVQNRQGYYWDLEEIHARLLRIVEREGRAIWNISRDRGVGMRTAAYVHALSRLATAIEAHGTQSFFAS
jgi:glutamate dehydrogenase (NADP+)